MLPSTAFLIEFYKRIRRFEAERGLDPLQKTRKTLEDVEDVEDMLRKHH